MLPILNSLLISFWLFPSTCSLRMILASSLACFVDCYSVISLCVCLLTSSSSPFYLIAHSSSMTTLHQQVEHLCFLSSSFSSFVFILIFLSHLILCGFQPGFVVLNMLTIVLRSGDKNLTRKSNRLTPSFDFDSF